MCKGNLGKTQSDQDRAQPSSRMIKSVARKPERNIVSGQPVFLRARTLLTRSAVVLQQPTRHRVFMVFRPDMSIPVFLWAPEVRWNLHVPSRARSGRAAAKQILVGKQDADSTKILTFKVPVGLLVQRRRANGDYFESQQSNCAKAGQRIPMHQVTRIVT